MTAPFEERIRSVLTHPDETGVDQNLQPPPGQYRCPTCNEPYRRGTACDGCVTCSRCQRAVPEPDSVRTLSGETVCPTCSRNLFWSCDTCEGLNAAGTDCLNGCCDPNGCDCVDCAESYDDTAYRGVFSYSYKPTPMFHGTGPLYLGPEIEIETPYGRDRECAEIAHTHLGRLGYLKSDSSLERGFEIVTHPMAYDWAMAHFPWDMLTQLRDAGCDAPDNTGIHVHVSRAGFTSTCHTYRWMKFIYRNEAQVKIVARRSSDMYAAFTDQDRQAVQAYAKGAYGQRYRAINTNNADTFELRIFASSLKPRDVQAALGFAAATVEYTRHLTANTIARRGGWTWSAFVDWLTRAPQYGPLLAQLEELACVS